MPNSYRRRIDQTVVYLPSNLEVFDKIREEIRTTFRDTPPGRVVLSTDDDRHLIISVHVAGAWADADLP